MSHFGKDIRISTTTPSEWLRVGSQIGDLVNSWSLRSDLVVLMADEISAPVAALYNPDLSEIEVNTPKSFGAITTPEMVGDMRLRKQQFENAEATGIIFHEACHARFSRFSLEDASKQLTPREFEALMWLEESRAEGWGVKALPDNKSFLRACALEIAIGDVADKLDGFSDVRGAAFMAALSLARVDADILDKWDVVAIDEAVTRILGADVLAELREVWLEFQAHADHFDFAPLLPLARKWDEIVTRKAQDEGQEDGDGEPQDGSGEGEMSDALAEALSALMDDATNTSFSGHKDIAEQQQAEEYREVAAAKTSSSKRNGEHQKVARKIFFDAKRENEGGEQTNSKLVSTRKPEAAERAAAVRVGQMLEKAKYRERDLTVRHSATPGGRLRTRALVQGKAYEAVGVHQQTDAWAQKVRKQTDEPSLTIGVMVDISGSMGMAMNPMASTAWVLSESIRRVQGRTAMVYYGSSVFPTLKPGQHLTDVSVYSASDYTEKFDLGFQALDGGLNLLNGSGARMLVVVSDGEYTPSESDAAKRWVRECQNNGVAVLWVSYRGQNGGAKRITNGTDAVLVNVPDDVTAASLEIGKAAVTAMNKVGVRKMA